MFPSKIRVHRRPVGPRTVAWACQGAVRGPWPSGSDVQLGGAWTACPLEDMYSRHTAPSEHTHNWVCNTPRQVEHATTTRECLGTHVGRASSGVVMSVACARSRHGDACLPSWALRDVWLACLRPANPVATHAGATCVAGSDGTQEWFAAAATVAIKKDPLVNARISNQSRLIRTCTDILRSMSRLKRNKTSSEKRSVKCARCERYPKGTRLGWQEGVEYNCRFIAKFHLD